MISVELDKLVDMMAHPCHHCTFFIEAGLCPADNGCKQGIKKQLKKEFGLKDEE